jgi:bifunctional UDP-N-acetylglucosamine pyrophosphorylase/glucosamine-1-phosphate N-acetyltransferase
MQEYLQGYSNCQLVLQSERLGTAHAVFCALDKIKTDSFVVVVYADHPFIDSAIIGKAFDNAMQGSSACTLLAHEHEEENSYGRIIHNQGNVLKIVEAKDLAEEEKGIRLCNSAVICFAPGVLKKYLPIVISEKKFSEYYLTSIVEILATNNQKVSYFIDLEDKYSLGVNTKQELYNANKLGI